MGGDWGPEFAVIIRSHFSPGPPAKKFPSQRGPWQKVELALYLARLRLTPLFKAWLDEIPRAPKRTNDFLVELNQQVARDVRYLIRMEPGVQTPEETIALGSGSCRDSGWLLVQILRHLGIAARFVSGYLVQLAPDVKSLHRP